MGAKERRVRAGEVNESIFASFHFTVDIVVVDYRWNSQHSSEREICFGDDIYLELFHFLFASVRLDLRENDISFGALSCRCIPMAKFAETTISQLIFFFRYIPLETNWQIHFFRAEKWSIGSVTEIWSHRN